MEVFDGKLLGFWSSSEAIIFRNLSEAEEYGRSNECEINPIVERLFSIPLLYQERKLEEKETKFDHRFRSLRHPTDFSSILQANSLAFWLGSFLTNLF